MNHIQFLVFIVYCCAVLIAGITVYMFLDKAKGPILNRSVYIGESFLLGSILVIGELLVLSLSGLYKAPYLWGCIGLNFLFLLSSEVRRNIVEELFGKRLFSIPALILSALLGFFIF